MLSLIKVTYECITNTTHRLTMHDLMLDKLNSICHQKKYFITENVYFQDHNNILYI